LSISVREFKLRKRDQLPTRKKFQTKNKIEEACDKYEAAVKRKS
jgi:hypothetical protein